MPSPYAHAIAGVVLATPYLKNKITANLHREEIATIIGFSLAPDLDAIPGVLTQNLSAYHNQISHSILFGIAVCIAYAGIRRLFPHPKPSRRIFPLAAGAYALHLLMDFFTYGRGLMLFWPITQRRFQPPVTIFYGLRYSEGWFSQYHLITLATETLTMLPILILAWIILKKGDRAHVQ